MKINLSDLSIRLDTFAEYLKVIECIRGERSNNQDYNGFGVNAPKIFKEVVGSLEVFLSKKQWFSSRYRINGTGVEDIAKYCRMLDLDDEYAKPPEEMADWALYDICCLSMWVSDTRTHRELKGTIQDNATFFGIQTQFLVSDPYYQEYLSRAGDNRRGAEANMYIKYFNSLVRSQDLQQFFNCFCRDIPSIIGAAFYYSSSVGNYWAHDELGTDCPNDVLVQFEDECRDRLYDSVSVSQDTASFFPLRVHPWSEIHVLTQKDWEV